MDAALRRARASRTCVQRLRCSRRTPGILEAEALVRALARLLTEHGALLLPGTPSSPASHARDAIEVRTPRQNASTRGRSSTPPGCTRTRFPRRSAVERSASIHAAASTRSSYRQSAGWSTVSSIRCRNTHSLGIHLTQDHPRQRDARPDRALPGAQGRLRGRPPAGRGVSRAGAAAAARAARWRTCGSAAAASGPKLHGSGNRRSRIS